MLSPVTAQTSQTRNFPNAVQQNDTNKKQKELLEVTQKFESVFLSILMKGMRKTINKNQLFNGGFAEDVFQEMLDVKVAESMSQNNGGLGIANLLFNYFNKFVKTE